MEFFKSIESFVPSKKPVVMTLGNFDGVHKGHQYVINKTVEKARQLTGKSLVFTFSNHPSCVLANQKPVSSLCSATHKIVLISHLSIDCLVQIPFTLRFSRQTPYEFLKMLKHHIPFQHLVLGHDATFGKNQTGDKETVKKLSEIMGFTTEYIEPITLNNNIISSSRIRTLLSEGDLNQVELLLGRKFSIMGNVINGNQIGNRLGFPTANIDISELCLPPFGVYTIQFHIAQRSIPGIANLGVVPTVRNSNKPLLKVFLFEGFSPIIGQSAEVVLGDFIRKEIRFSSTKELQAQISKDILIAKQKLSQSQNPES